MAILVALFGPDDKVYSVLVDQPRVPLGRASTLEIPAGMVEGDSVKSAALQELSEECGMEAIKASELTDLTALSCEQAVTGGSLPSAAIPPSPGGCDEAIRYVYLEKNVTADELDELQGKLTGLREEGEMIALRVVPFDDVWRVSGDAKAIVYVLGTYEQQCDQCAKFFTNSGFIFSALFLLNQLRKDNKLPPAGQLATPLK